MRIDKALEHQKWRLENSKNRTSKDIEAFNSILDWKELQQQQTLQRNESLAKLWIHQLMLLNNTEMYTGQRAIGVIDEILSKSVYEWCLSLKDNIPMMRFNGVLSEPNYKEGLRHGNITKMRESAIKTIEERHKELNEALVYEISEENIIKFVEKEINRVINTFEK
jgi:hypothetical protein